MRRTSFFVGSTDVKGVDPILRTGSGIYETKMRKLILDSPFKDINPSKDHGKIIDSMYY